METINSSIPNSDKHVISPHNITTWSGHENEDDLSWFLCKFSWILSNSLPLEVYEEQWRELMRADIGAWRVNKSIKLWMARMEI